MNIENMTPEQLREYAAQKEAMRANLENKYYDGQTSVSEAAAKIASTVKDIDGNVPVIEQHKPWERPIDVDDEIYWIDSRQVYSERFVVKMAEIQRYIKREGEEPIADMLELFDLVMGSESEHIRNVVIAKTGFDDIREIYRIKEAIFDKLDIKN